MSQEPNAQSTDASGQTPAPSTGDGNAEAFVSRKAYEEVTADMHKFKQRSKAEQARVNELETQVKAIEENRMKEQQQWKELYEKERQAREEFEKQRKSERDTFLRQNKIAALKSELGANIRNEYLGLCNLDEIEVTDDGAISPDSLRAVANKFRQEHPALIPSTSATQITNPAPSAGAVKPQSPKTLKDMSYDEKVAYLSQLKTNR
jgi:uncharacterized protein YaiL (DUF2058 family)